MRRKFITLLFIASFSFYCTFCGEKSSTSSEQEIQESYSQGTDTSIESVVQNPSQQKEDTNRKSSKESLPVTTENAIEVWLMGVAQQVLALAVWYGIKQTIKIIFIKKIRIARR
ncbi:MAG: hypothetical protein K2J95_11770 [Lachnospiraceae bacterium]|nr:hypothetical protein [Lachnospiraceae bacterium]